jgi:hypothetical protein
MVPDAEGDPVGVTDCINRAAARAFDPMAARS